MKVCTPAIRLTRVLMVMAIGVAFWAGCGGSQATLKPAPTVQRQQEPDAEREAEERARAEAEAKAREARTFSNVYFAYDRFNIRDDQRSVLTGHAERLKADPEFKVTVEGHCDDRGTIEYNMALGQKRAASAKSFLVKAGVAAGRLATVSYGKERPAESGHDESAWAKNRRAEFKVLEPAVP